MFRWLFLLISLLFAPLAFAGAVDVNTADQTELDTLPGIGPAKARAILEYRAANGRFTDIEAVGKVPGIGPATMANIRALISIGTVGGVVPEDVGAPPAVEAPAAAAPARGAVQPPTNAVNINKASAAELQTLPGIGPTKAEAIAADRETNGPFSGCQDLGRVAGIGPATVANVASRCIAK